MSKQPSPRADALRAKREQQAAAAEADARIAAAAARKAKASVKTECPSCKDYVGKCPKCGRPRPRP